MQAKLQEQLSTADATVILERLPERIRMALIEHAADIEYPIEAVVEMAFGFAMPSAFSSATRTANASFLDSEALGFADCKPGRGQ